MYACAVLHLNIVRGPGQPHPRPAHGLPLRGEVQRQGERAGVGEVAAQLVLARVHRVRVDHQPGLHEVAHVHGGEHHL